MSRIDDLFARLREENRPALIPFIMGGDPDLKTSGAIMSTLAEAGADILEVGIPFSDPMADGPVIQAAGLRALENGATLSGILTLVKNFRAKNTHTPVVLMGYYNPIYRYGAAKFCKDAVKAGVDGVIVVDLPPEEEGELRAHLKGLHLVRLIAPTTGDDRLSMLMGDVADAGFVYYIAVAGITGAASADVKRLKRRINHLRQFSDVPIAVGFGIKTSMQAREIGLFADAVVVGSALVDIISKQKDKKSILREARKFVSSLADFLRY